jgi:hypothetical protein
VFEVKWVAMGFGHVGCPSRLQPAVTEETARASEAADFLIAHGGPFYELQSRLNARTSNTSATS